MPEILINRLRNIWPIVVAVIYIAMDWALTGERLRAAGEDIDKLESAQSEVITQHVLDLTLEPLKRDIEYQSEAIKRIEQNVYESQRTQKEILKALQHLPTNNAHTN